MEDSLHVKYKNKCCVPGCTDRYSKRHRFPKDTELMAKWIENINEPKLTNMSAEIIYRSHYVCNQHFADEYLVPGTKRGLTKDAIPTICLPVKPEGERYVECKRTTASAVTEMTTSPVRETSDEGVPVEEQEVWLYVSSSASEVDTQLSEGHQSQSNQEFCPLQQNIKSESSRTTKRTRILQEVNATRLKNLCFPRFGLGVRLSPETIADVPSTLATPPEIEEEQEQPPALDTRIDDCETMDYKVLDNPNLCRTCMCESKSMHFIYEKVNDTSAAEKIALLTNITFSEDDQLPSKVCSLCMHKLDIAYDFRKKCEESNATLQGLLNGKKNRDTNETSTAKSGQGSDSEVSASDDDQNNETIKENYVCEICNKEYVKREGLVVHMRVHTGEKPFLCQHCGKGFIRSDVLLRHMQVHTNERQFKCKICNKGFKQKFHLEEHERAHSGVKEYKCEECGKTFTRYGVLRVHMRTHMGVKLYQCHLCFKNFVGSDTLTRHLRVHTMLKPYRCKKCGRRFSQKTHLKTHNKVHFGLRPHSCNICFKSFTQKHGLKVHFLSHTSEKPCLCGTCGKSFVRSDDLKKHGKIHSQERPYWCSLCPKTFTQSFQLLEHVRAHADDKRL